MQDYYNRKLDRSITEFSTPHSFKLTWVYETPFGKGRRYNARVIGLTGLGCLAAGLALSPFIPVIMKLWTTSYGLMSAGWACLLFLAFYWTIDVAGHRGWSLFLVVIGVNALAAYLGPTIVQTHRMTNPFLKPWLPRIGVFGPVLATGAVLLVNWLVLRCHVPTWMIFL